VIESDISVHIYYAGNCSCTAITFMSSILLQINLLDVQLCLWNCFLIVLSYYNTQEVLEDNGFLV
jgi:hypothetical protein